MTKAERELTLFVNDPTYRQEVITRVHKERDRDYERRIRTLRSDREGLISDRSKMISRINNERWEQLFKGKLCVNKTEGKIKINNAIVSYSDIRGAELNIQMMYRVVTEDTSKTKKNASLGGAVLGGVVTGNALGAMVGAVGLGKQTTRGTSVQNQIPICAHLGVLVNINGFVSEISILSNQVELSSDDYIRAESEAQGIISTLVQYANTPVPFSFLRIEDDPRVREYDEKIVRKDQDIQFAIFDKPTYDIPAMYRTEEQKYMTDADYLEYLAKEDAIRGDTKNNLVTSRRILHIVGDVFGWIISVIIFNIALLAAVCQFIPSTMVFIGAAISSNPLIYKLIKTKWYFASRWIFVLACIGSIILGIGLIVSPST